MVAQPCDYTEIHRIVHRGKFKDNVMASRDLTIPVVQICDRQTNCPGLSGTEEGPGM